MCYDRRRAEACLNRSASGCVCVYYYRTYYKAVCGGGRRRVEDMCYDRRRAEACADESAHHALANAGGRLWERRRGAEGECMFCDDSVFMCLLLQDLLQSCSRGGRRRVEDIITAVPLIKLFVWECFFIKLFRGLGVLMCVCLLLQDQYSVFSNAYPR